ncbi:MAG TPA: hypothetical protein VJQ83_12795 [Tepidiformaceae bacterium]|nr:hypothetical protein [Tepidiformaceae bacterium]
MASSKWNPFAWIMRFWRRAEDGASGERVAEAMRDNWQVRRPPNAMNLWGKDMSEQERDRLDGRR